MAAAVPVLGTVAGAGKLASKAAKALGSKGGDTVDLFRFVSKGELNDLAATGGKFRPAPNSLDGKQFGRNLDEVQELGDRIGGADAIVRARVPRSTVNALDQTPVDSFILRSGSVTAQPGSQLDLLNRTVIRIDRVR